MKKALVIIATVILGSIALTIIDIQIGVNKAMTDVPVWAQLIHGVSYMLWGVAITRPLWK